MNRLRPTLASVRRALARALTWYHNRVERRVSLGQLANQHVAAVRLLRRTHERLDEVERRLAFHEAGPLAQSASALNGARRDGIIQPEPPANGRRIHLLNDPT